MAGVIIGDEIADLAQGGRHIKGVGGHGLEKGGVAAGHGQQPVAQLVGQLLVTIEHAVVEEDGGVEQGLGVRFADPGTELLAPLVEGQAKLGIAGHDVALAQGETAGSEVVVNILGKLQQPQFEGLLVGPFGQDVENPVVLVGGQGLFVTPLGAEGQPGVFDTIKVVAVEIEFDDATGQGIVEGRDELGKLLGTDALGQQVERQLADVAAGPLQGLNVGGTFDAGADLAQADALQGEQVAFRDHALELVVGIDNQDMTHTVSGHLQRCVVGAGAGVEGVGRCCHHFGDGAGQVEARQHDTLEDVTLGQHAHRLLVFPGHGKAADAGFDHPLEGGAGGKFGADENRRLFDQVREGRGHRLLFGSPLRELDLQLLPRLVEEAGDVTGTEQLERGAEFLQLEKIGRRQLEAVAVLHGDVAVG